MPAAVAALGVTSLAEATLIEIGSSGCSSAMQTSYTGSSDHMMSFEQVQGVNNSGTAVGWSGKYENGGFVGTRGMSGAGSMEATELGALGEDRGDWMEAGGRP